MGRPEQLLRAFKHSLEDVIASPADLLDYRPDLFAQLLLVDCGGQNQVCDEIEAFVKVPPIAHAAPIENDLLASLGADVCAQPINGRSNGAVTPRAGAEKGCVFQQVSQTVLACRS